MNKEFETAEYVVRTLHPETGNLFIVPVSIAEADSHLDAARKRFDMQVRSSQEGTSAILVERVVDGHRHGDPHMFRVENRLEVVA